MPLSVWLNVSDDDAEKYIKIFDIFGAGSSSTTSSKNIVKTLVVVHFSTVLQKRSLVWYTHRKTLIWPLLPLTSSLVRALEGVILQLDEQTFTDVFKDVPHYEVSKDVLGQPAVEVFNQEGMQIFQARVTMRKLVKGGGVSLNKEKLQPSTSQ